MTLSYNLHYLRNIIIINKKLKTNHIKLKIPILIKNNKVDF